MVNTMFRGIIYDFIQDESIPYKWLFHYDRVNLDELTQDDLEKSFEALYSWTKRYFDENKPNAFNLLHNALWLDERISNFNWEYSNLYHYKSRLLIGFNTVKGNSPCTIKSFLKKEMVSLDCLHSNLENGDIVFLEHVNHGDDVIFCGLNIASANISSIDQNELMDILRERISDKIKYVNLLLDSESERNSVFSPEKIVQSGHEDCVEGGKRAEVPKYEINSNNLDVESLTIPPEFSVSGFSEETSEPDDSNFVTASINSRNASTDPKLTDKYIKKIKDAITGDELLKMFFYLDQNVVLGLKSNANPTVIKYSAIYFVLSDAIQEQEILIENLGWEIDKKSLGKALGLKLKTSRRVITKKHLKKVESALLTYKSLIRNSIEL